ncbi:MAG: leucyl/phenylalanyl-tRNA--protein transferase [Pseudomonadota bacterium]
MIRIRVLKPGCPPDHFPDARDALDDPNGLLAAGGDLSAARLVYAYRHGIFPWYEEDQPILWWSPDPRAVFTPGDLRISRSLRKTLKKGAFRCTFDRAFADVVDACAAPRDDDVGTWITEAMREAYVELHRQGTAHSVECWLEDELVGGLYGVAVGRLFCGESMFSRVSNASKVALCALSDWLTAWNYALIDCQMPTEHLESLGAREMSRAQFLEQLSALRDHLAAPDAWQAPTETDQPA